MNSRKWSTGWLVIVMCIAAWLPSEAAIDRDGDQISDIWQKQFSVTSSAEDDEDGDGADNRAESEAGTDPRDSNSLFRILGCHWIGESGSVCVQWMAVQGKSYRVEARCLFDNGASGWLELGQYHHRDPDDSIELTLVEPEGSQLFASGQCFVRIVVEDRDQDGDGLNDWEERVVGTDPDGDSSGSDLNQAIAWLDRDDSDEGEDAVSESEEDAETDESEPDEDSGGSSDEDDMDLGDDESGSSEDDEGEAAGGSSDEDDVDGQEGSGSSDEDDFDHGDDESGSSEDDEDEAAGGSSDEDDVDGQEGSGSSDEDDFDYGDDESGSSEDDEDEVTGGSSSEDDVDGQEGSGSSDEDDSDHDGGDSGSSEGHEDEDGSGSSDGDESGSSEYEDEGGSSGEGDFDDEENDEGSEDDEQDTIAENGFPTLLANGLSISQGEAVVLSSANLLATDPNDRADRLTYQVSDVNGGRFEVVSSGSEVRSFTQADLNAGRIRYAHDGGLDAPQYRISVSDGERQTGPVAGAIHYRSLRDQQRPVIVRNEMAIIQNERLVLGPQNFAGASPIAGAGGALSYTVSGVSGGRFENANAAGVALTQWSEAELAQGAISFVQDGSDTAPSYSLVATDGREASLPSRGVVRFYPDGGTGVSPRMIANSLTLRQGDRITLGSAHIDALDPDSVPENLVFRVSELTGGQFEQSGLTGIRIDQFTQAEINRGNILFAHDGTSTKPAYMLSVTDGVNSVEPIAASVSFCDGSKTSMMTESEMSAFNKLAPIASATHVVARSGAWSDPRVWQGGVLPEDGARIHVPTGMAVVVDRILDPEFKTVRVDGMLRFAPYVSTRLQVDTLISTHCARVEIGTPQIPIAANAKAEIVFADDGAIDTSIDFAQLGRGAVLLGESIVHGALRTSRHALAEHAQAGAQEIVLSSMPKGWQIGDELVVTGTMPNNPVSDEVRTITSIADLRIGLDRPLAIDHVAPRSDLNVYVANMTRNVVLRSENPDTARRGHIMFMHTLKADVRYARFDQLGRTDKTRSLDDVTFLFDDDRSGNNASAPVHFTTTPGERTNIRGRYPIHLHRGGTDPSTRPALIEGSVVVGSPGWGFVSHSAHARFVNNVSYAVQGTGFYTEAGDEVGEMVGNIAIRSVNSRFSFDSLGGAIDPDLGFEEQEFGNDGDGFWLSGHRVAMRNNVSAGSSAHGIIYWTDGLVEGDIPRGRASVKVSEIPNGHLIPNRETIPVWWAPLAEVSGNECYGSSVGFRVRYTHAQTYMGEGGSPFHASPPQAYIDSLRPEIDGLTVWGSRDGVLLNYTARMSVKNSLIVGIGAPFVLDGGTANSGVGLDMGTEVTSGFGRVENVTIEGFEMGYVVPRNDQWVFEDLTLRNVTDMLIAELRQGPRTLTMNGVEFGSLEGTAVAGRLGRRNVVLQADLEYIGFQPYWFVMPDRITLNGQGIYFDQQAANFVPLRQPLEEPLVNVPQEYFNQTNRQLAERFGLSYGGAIPPADARPESFVVGGVVGSMAPAAVKFPLVLDMTNDGFSPEDPKGGPDPELTANYLTIRSGQTVTLMATNLNATDTNTELVDLVYEVSNVSGGYFAHRDQPDQPITRFNQADVNGGVIRFVHDGGNQAPSYQVSVTDGRRTDGPRPVDVRFN